jgi:protein-export chaperone SecB
MIADDNYQLLRIYVANLSVESPLTGRLQRQINQPNIDIHIDTKITLFAGKLYEVAARFTLTARSNSVPLYLIELTQAGLFSISAAGEAQRETLLRRVFPQFIYPAARNNIASFIVAAGYQPVVLEHILLENFFTNTVLELS